MMKIELQKIDIEHFKGIKSLSLDFTEGQCVRGDNGTGKTSIFDAVCWVLFDKDSKGAANFQLKPVDESGAEVHNIESIVDAVFIVDGKPTRLRKSHKEKWVKKRGSAAKTFEGHTTSYAVDEVPVSLKEYKAAVSGIVEEGIFKLLTNPYEFSSLHWKDRRSILMQICGDVSDEDVIASNSELSELSAMLGDRGIDDAKKILAQRRKAINKELNDIPVRIQELNHAEPAEKPDLKRKAELESELADHKSRLANETDASAIKEKELEIREITAKISEIRNAAIEHPEKAGLQKRLSEIHQEVQIDQNDHNANRHKIDRMIDEKERLDIKIVDLRGQWANVNGDEFSTDLVCPTCGQEMPEDRIDSAREAFNQNKADTLKNINTKGKGLAAEAKSIAEKLGFLIGENTELDDKISRMSADAKAIKKRIEGMVPTVDTAAIETLEGKRRAIEKDIAAIRDGSASRRDAILIDIEETESEISIISAQEAAIKADEARVKRVAELEEQEKALAAEFEATEKSLHTMDLFIVSKVDMLESSINSRFKLATFKMFLEQVNGGVEECCEILCGGVPFGRGLNTGASINTGLDIINTLSDYHGIQAPIFVDNSESVTQLIETGSQLIKLVVDPAAKTLTQTEE